MFTELMGNIKGEILHNMFRSTSNLLAFEQFLSQLPMHLLAPQLDGDQGGQQHPQAEPTAGDGEPGPSIQLSPQRREMPKVGRNDPCPCGSGKKYKHCHGRLA